MTLRLLMKIRKIPQCPPEGARPVSRTSFRFVHSPTSDGRNFLCPAELNPARQFKNTAQKCAAHALSMFTTREKAVEFYRGLQVSNKQIHKTLGTHLACGRITEQDGIATRPGFSGHFDLFDFQDASFSTTFEIVEELHNA